MEDMIVGTFDFGDDDGGLDKKTIAEQENNPALSVGLVVIFIVVVTFLYTQVAWRFLLPIDIPLYIFH